MSERKEEPTTGLSEDMHLALDQLSNAITSIEDSQSENEHSPDINCDLLDDALMAIEEARSVLFQVKRKRSDPFSLEVMASLASGDFLQANRKQWVYTVRPGLNYLMAVHQLPEKLRTSTVYHLNKVLAKLVPSELEFAGNAAGVLMVYVSFPPNLQPVNGIPRNLLLRHLTELLATCVNRATDELDEN